MTRIYGRKTIIKSRIWDGGIPFSKPELGNAVDRIINMRLFST